MVQLAQLRCACDSYNHTYIGVGVAGQLPIGSSGYTGILNLPTLLYRSFVHRVIPAYVSQFGNGGRPEDWVWVVTCSNGG